jgi:hypothetical protein
MKVQVVKVERSPYALKEIEVEGKFAGATISENIIVIYVKGEA